MSGGSMPELPGYTFLRVLGSGGFGTSYLAQRRADGLDCVVKALSFARLQDWKSLELFEREAKILKQLKHEQIPRFLEYVTRTRGEQQEIFLIQTYIAGHSLQEYIAQHGHLSEAQVLQMAIELTEVLVYLQGFAPPLIHRDIKPANVVLSEQGPAFLIDFGAVRDSLADPSRGGSTVVGTFGYMAPEQFQGQANCATDIYSLGTTLVYALTHKAPSELKTEGLKLVFRPLLRVSLAFADLLGKMLEPDWQLRYPDAQALLADLRALQSGQLTSLQQAELALLALSESDPPQQITRYQKMLYGGLALVVGYLLLIITLNLFFVQQPPESRENHDAVRQRLEKTYEELYHAEFGPPPQPPVPPVP